MAKKRRRKTDDDQDAFGVIAAGLVGLAGGLYGLSKEEEARQLKDRLAKALTYSRQVETYAKRLVQVRNDERAAFLRLQDEIVLLRKQKAELEAELQACRRDNEALREASQADD